MKARTAILCILTLLLALALTACDSEPKEPPDLRGEWRQIPSEDSAEETNYYHVATITDDKITIYYVSADGTRDLYWNGTFVPPPRKNIKNPIYGSPKISCLEPEDFATLPVTAAKSSLTKRDSSVICWLPVRFSALA